MSEDRMDKPNRVRLLERVEQTSYPAFDKEIGQRMKLVRMKWGMDQAELGKILGCSQKQVSRLESGQLDVAPVTYSKFRAAFSPFLEFIFFGLRDPNWSHAQVLEAYWKGRFNRRSQYGESYEADIIKRAASYVGKPLKKAS